jgi:hypothetical protein
VAAGKAQVAVSLPRQQQLTEKMGVLMLYLWIMAIETEAKDG